MRNLPGALHASKSHLVLEPLENRLAPALSVLSSAGLGANLSVLQTLDHLVKSELGVTSDERTTQISDVTQMISADAQPLLRSSEVTAAALVSTTRAPAQPLAEAVAGVANDATGLASASGRIVTSPTETVASATPINGTNVAWAIASSRLLGTVKSQSVETSPIAPGVPAELLAIASVLTRPSRQALVAAGASMNAPSAGQMWLDEPATWQGGFDGSSDVAQRLSCTQAAETGATTSAGNEGSTAGMTDVDALQAETLPMTEALAVNKLEAAASAAAKQLADTLSAEFAWLGTIHPSVWLMCALFVFMSHSYWTRRRAKGLWPGGGTPWSTALADVVPAR